MCYFIWSRYNFGGNTMRRGTRSKGLRALVMFAALGLVAVACGDDDDTAGEETATTAAQAAATTTAAPATDTTGAAGAETTAAEATTTAAEEEDTDVDPDGVLRIAMNLQSTPPNCDTANPTPPSPNIVGPVHGVRHAAARDRRVRRHRARAGQGGRVRRRVDDPHRAAGRRDVHGRHAVRRRGRQDRHRVQPRQREHGAVGRAQSHPGHHRGRPARAHAAPEPAVRRRDHHPDGLRGLPDPVAQGTGRRRRSGHAPRSVPGPSCSRKYRAARRSRW